MSRCRPSLGCVLDDKCNAGLPLLLSLTHLLAQLLMQRIWSPAISALVWCYVTDLCKDFDVIVGNTFLTEHNAVLDFQRLTVSLTRHGKRFTLKAGLKTETVTDNPLFMNCAQARRSLKNGCEAFLVMVNALVNDTDTDTDAAKDVNCTENVTITDTGNSLADGIDSLRLRFADAASQGLAA